MLDNSEICIMINEKQEEIEKSLCIDCIHYDSQACICCYEEKE